jgi:hypothetical protein
MNTWIIPQLTELTAAFVEDGGSYTNDLSGPGS